MNTALRASSETLRQVLLDAMRADPVLRLLFTPLGAATVSLANPDEMVNGGETGLSLWLYRIIRDDQRLNAPPERIAPDRYRPTPLPVRLHYLISPVLGDAAGPGAPETSQQMLGAVLQTFHERPLISGSLLVGDFAGTTVELALRLESLGLEEIARIWDSLDLAYQLSLSYECGVVSIFTTEPDGLAPPVGIALPEYGTASLVGAP
jgi:hypothetical protein